MVNDTVMATAEPMMMPINTAIGRMPFLLHWPGARLNRSATDIQRAKLSNLMTV
jgi:hypothetical protein